MKTHSCSEGKRVVNPGNDEETLENCHICDGTNKRVCDRCRQVGTITCLTCEGAKVLQYYMSMTRSFKNLKHGLTT